MISGNNNNKKNRGCGSQTVIKKYRQPVAYHVSYLFVAGLPPRVVGG